MVFSSLFFVYVFLPINLILYACAKKLSIKNNIMLIFSVIFYAWGEPKYIILLLIMVFFDWLLAMYIERHIETTKAKVGLIFVCIINLGLLGVFKYGSFILENVYSITGFTGGNIPLIELPIGISFYTFQLLSYVVDVYRKEVPAQRSYASLLLYAGLFHQCVAGPIVRYKDINDELFERVISREDLNKGINRFSIGLAKKAVLANSCGSIADSLILSDATLSNSALILENVSSLSNLSVLGAWIGVLAYMLQIYLDFSAYSDMAIGMGQMIGFHYKENFDYPYISRNVVEFWRRWHISLGTFFRDYVYIPLGGNRCSKVRCVLNLLAVWFLTGLWHGASWNFVLWGLYFFIFIVLERFFLRKLLDLCPSFVSHVYLLFVVFTGWILFKFRNLGLGLIVFKGLFGLNGNPLYNFENYTIFTNNIFFLIIALISVTPLISKVNKSIISFTNNNATYIKWSEILVPVFLMIISTISLIGNSYNPFLYFQF